MFAMDAFDPKFTIMQQIEGFIIHLIPTYILIALLIVSWKWELIGGLIFILIGLGFSPYIFSHNYHMNHSIGMSLFVVLMINIPFALVGLLFIVSHYKKRKVEHTI
jgi:predicted membrane protein